jgi:hypothetical protein
MWYTFYRFFSYGKVTIMTSKSQNVSVLLKHLDTPKRITPATTVPIWVHGSNSVSLPKKTTRNQRTHDSVWRVPLNGTLWEKWYSAFEYPKSNNWGENDPHRSRKVPYSSVLYSTSGVFNRETGKIELDETQPKKTFIQFPELNIPTIFSEMQSVLYKYDSVYALPECAENLLGGNHIFDHATVDPRRVNMRDAHCRVSGSANVESGLITKEHMLTDGHKLTHSSHKGESRIIIAGDTTVRNSNIHHIAELTGNTLVEDSTTEDVLTTGKLNLTLRNTIVSHSEFDGAQYEKDSPNISVTGGELTNVHVRLGANLNLSGNVLLDKVFFSGGDISISGDAHIEDSNFGGWFDLKALDSHTPMSDLTGFYLLPLLLKPKFEYRVRKNHGKVENVDFTESAYSALITSSKMIEGGFKMERFCALPKVHKRDNCLCALYYPALLFGNPLGVTYYLKASGLENHIPEEHKGKSWAELEQVLNHETAELGSRLARGGSAAHYATWQERNDIYDHEAWNEHIAFKYHVAPADLLGIR